jgi:O-succinylhomoserine sulfhydrylase
MKPQPDYLPETLAVRAGQERSQFNEHSEALYLTSSFVFTSAAQAAARFSGEEEGNVYSRFTNPTVAVFQDRLAALEGARPALPPPPACRPSSRWSWRCAAAAITSSPRRAVRRHAATARHHHAALRNPDQLCRADRCRGVAGRDAAGNEAVLSRNAVESADRNRRHRCPGGDRACAAACWWRSTTVSVRRFCSGRSISALIWSSIRRPSSSMARGGFSAVPSPGRGKLTDEVFKFLRTAGPTLSAFNAWVC